jgi:hypothetical protein
LLLPTGKKDAVSDDYHRLVEICCAAEILAQVGRTDGLADLIGPVRSARTLGPDRGAQPRTDKLVALTLPRFKASSMANLIGPFSQLCMLVSPRNARWPSARSCTAPSSR